VQAEAPDVLGELLVAEGQLAADLAEDHGQGRPLAKARLDLLAPLQIGRPAIA
jgi:hypothetical protein